MLYLIHFDRPYHHAAHYFGYCADGRVQERLAEHRSGHGSKLLRAVVAAGIAFEVVRTMPGDRKDERTIKRQRHTARFCPVCQKKPRTPLVVSRKDVAATVASDEEVPL